MKTLMLKIRKWRLRRLYRWYLRQTEPYSCGNELMFNIRPDLKSTYDKIKHEADCLKALECK